MQDNEDQTQAAEAKRVFAEKKFAIAKIAANMAESVCAILEEKKQRYKRVKRYSKRLARRKEFTHLKIRIVQMMAMAQMNMVWARPVPKYPEGGVAHGMASVGENGPELIGRMSFLSNIPARSVVAKEVDRDELNNTITFTLHKTDSKK